jgi:hypothetical protein
MMNRGALVVAAASVLAALCLSVPASDSTSRLRALASVVASAAAATIAWLLLSAPPRAAALSEDALAVAIAQALHRELLRPAVTVRHLERVSEHTAPLHDTLGLFRLAVARAARVDATTVRLYWFPRSPIVLSERVPIDSDAAFASFRSLPVLPDVFIFEPRGGVSTPPAALVIAGVADGALPIAAAAAADAPSVSDDGSRLSSVQSRFRAAVLGRDGAACVLCSAGERAGGGKSALEAAHVVAARAPAAVVASVELMNRYDTINGVTLCTDCHYYFDRHLWHATADGTVAVAGALLARVGCERWRALHGRALRTPATPGLREQWPPARLWAVQSALFEAAREQRRAAAEGRPFLCDVCCSRSKTEAALAAHKCRPAKLFATSAVFRAFPAAAAEGARRLTFDIDEGSAAEESDVDLSER